MTHSDADFDHLSWHDCHIWAIELRPGDPEQGDWTSDLALDIDFIVEWNCGVDGGGQFRVSPATLLFHGVTDLKIDIDWESANSQIALHPASIGSIERKPIEEQKVYLDRPYYRWNIILNWPNSSAIAFGAYGFTQTLHADPVATDCQQLSLKERNRLKSP